MVNVSDAGSSAATTNASGPAYMPSPMAMAQSAELSKNRDDTNTALASARRSGVLRAAALTHYQKAQADSRAQAAVAQVKERAQARDRRGMQVECAAEEEGREHVRQLGLEFRGAGRGRGTASSAA